MDAVHRVKAAPKISLKISNFETSFRPLTNPGFAWEFFYDHFLPKIEIPIVMPL